MSNIDECIICYKPLNGNYNITFANCIHGNCVHAECILQWSHTCPPCPTCPICRSGIYNDKRTINDIQNKIDYNTSSN